MNDEEREKTSYSRHLKAFKRGQWITKDGRTVFIQDVSNRHLYNTIRMLSRKIRSGQFYTSEMTSLMVAWLFKLQHEAHVRGELGRIDTRED